MALPKQSTPKYTCILPSDGQEVEYRPFLVQEQKSLLIALKLAQFEYLKAKFNSTPILLLDDIFDKLDNNRVKQLISLVNNNLFGQIFISDTDLDRTNKIISDIDSTSKVFNVWKEILNQKV